LTGRKHQGLRRLSPDLISKAIDETNAQVTRIGLTFLGTATFCLLSLFSPDSGLLGGSEKINVPLAGPVSFFGFMLLGPAVLIMLRVYLQIYVEHSNRLERLGRSMLTVRAPTLVPLKNTLIRFFSGLTFYLLLPMVMIFFAWKAAVFPAWGSGLLCVAVGAIASHAILPIRLSWRWKALLSVIAVYVVAGGTALGFGPLRRPFDLYHANLPGQWLPRQDLRGADLRYANLSGAHLSGANLFGAHLSGADLSKAHVNGADLDGAHLSGADLDGAHLSGVDLSVAHLNGANLNGANLDSAHLDGADLDGAKLSAANLSFANLSDANMGDVNLRHANLSGADLSSAENLTQTQLDEACGDANTKLPEGLTLKACPRNS
jgi:hypothetical protein